MTTENTAVYDLASFLNCVGGSFPIFMLVIVQKVLLLPGSRTPRGIRGKTKCTVIIRRWTTQEVRRVRDGVHTTYNRVLCFFSPYIFYTNH